MRVLCGPESDALMRGTAHPRRPSGFPPCHPQVARCPDTPGCTRTLHAPAVRELLGCPPFGRCPAGLLGPSRGLPGASWVSLGGARVRGACLLFPASLPTSSAPLVSLVSLTASSLSISHLSLPLSLSVYLFAPLTAYCLAPCLSLCVSLSLSLSRYVLLSIHCIYSSYLVSSYILSSVF